MLFSLLKTTRSLGLKTSPLTRVLAVSARAEQNREKQHEPPRSKPKSVFHSLLVLGGVAAGTYVQVHRESKEQTQEVAQEKLETPTDYESWHKTMRADLPTYTQQDVSKHDSLEQRVWVSYGVGVYDITDFVPQHPGSSKILLGAGSAIDPFWALYQQHNTPEVLTLLEQYRVGNIAASAQSSGEDEASPWAHEPKRHALLRPTSERPFNAEPPLPLLGDHFYTPNDIFYVRNHLPVPQIDADSYELEIELETTQAAGKVASKTLTYAQLKQLPRHTVTAAVMCGGNRRAEMARIKPIKGLSWTGGAVGNAQWTGVLLRDVLIEMGVQTHEGLHVVLEGADLDVTSHPYGASIPLARALDPRAEVLLAYEMNGQPLSRDHGYPVRAIIPGTVGARNVKWLTRVAVSEQESSSHWQQNDYKGFSPSTDWDTVDFSKSPAIQTMPVTSAICTPTAGEKVKVSADGYIMAHGYAWSGGGRRIVRVDLTADAGQTWHVAELEQENLPDGRHYGWSLWTARIPVDKAVGSDIEIWAKAVDSSYNVQPESFENIWNLRGVLANAYHRVKVQLC